MADVLTQLQDCMDQLATQMYACLSYGTYFPQPSNIPGQPQQTPLQANFPANTQDIGSTQDPTQSNSAPTQDTSLATASTSTTQLPTQPPTSSQPASLSFPGSSQTPEFLATLHELSVDLVVKEQQIEKIITVLPGIQTSEKEQVQRMQALEKELEEIEGERVKAVEEKERLLELVGGVVGKVRGL